LIIVASGQDFDAAWPTAHPFLKTLMHQIHMFDSHHDFKDADGIDDSKLNQK